MTNLPTQNGRTPSMLRMTLSYARRSYNKAYQDYEGLLQRLATQFDIVITLFAVVVTGLTIAIGKDMNKAHSSYKVGLIALVISLCLLLLSAWVSTRARQASNVVDIPSPTAISTVSNHGYNDSDLMKLLIREYSRAARHCSGECRDLCRVVSVLQVMLVCAVSLLMLFGFCLAWTVLGFR